MGHLGPLVLLVHWRDSLPNRQGRYLSSVSNSSWTAPASMALMGAMEAYQLQPLITSSRMESVLPVATPTLAMHGSVCLNSAHM